VLKLPAGSSTWVELPPSGLFQPWAVAVDAAGGGVYVTAPADNRVLKLPAGSSAWVVGEVVAPHSDCPGSPGMPTLHST
jgi:DNA-binding beta-propeller fold protein YncE